MDNIEFIIKDILGENLYYDLIDDWHDTKQFPSDFQLTASDICDSDDAIVIKPGFITLSSKHLIVRLLKKTFDSDQRSNIPAYIIIIVGCDEYCFAINDMNIELNTTDLIVDHQLCITGEQVGISIKISGDRGDCSTIVPVYQNPEVKFPGEMFIYDSQLIIASKDSYFCLPLQEKNYQEATVSVDDSYYRDGVYYVKDGVEIKVKLEGTLYSKPEFTLKDTNTDGCFYTAWKKSPIGTTSIISDQITIGNVKYYLAGIEKVVNIEVTILNEPLIVSALHIAGKLVVKVKGGLIEYFQDTIDIGVPIDEIKKSNDCWMIISTVAPVNTIIVNDGFCSVSGDVEII